MNQFTVSSRNKNMELSVEVESMAFTASIFIVRYSPQIFNTNFDIRHSNIISEVNYLDFGLSENFQSVDMQIDSALRD